jgi:hypothetical protein
MYIDNFHRFRDAVRRKCLEKWRTNIWFLLHDNAPAHRWLWSRISEQVQCDNTGESSIHSWPDSSWFLPVPSNKTTLKWKRVCFVVEVIKIAMTELKRLLQMTSRNVATPLQSLAEAYICKRGEFCRKYGLNSCTVLHFLEKKWFREKFGANI